MADYAKGELSVSEIAKLHRTTDKNVTLIANRFWRTLTNMKESRALKAGSGPEDAETYYGAKASLEELKSTELVNQSFLKLLSEPETHLLTDAEATYAWAYVHTGDPIESLKIAGLDAGLIKDKSKPSRFSFDAALRYRSLYLNAKPNVVAYIKELREKRLIDADVGKARVQSELVEQLESMKASPEIGKHRSAILKTIELLGKTVGAFVDRVEVTEVDPSNALDQLIEMAKEAEVRELQEPKTTEVTQ